MKKPTAKPALSELVLAAMKYYVKPSTASSIANYIDWKDHGRFVDADVLKTLVALEATGQVERARARERWQLVARPKPVPRRA